MLLQRKVQAMWIVGKLAWFNIDIGVHIRLGYN